MDVHQFSKAFPDIFHGFPCFFAHVFSIFWLTFNDVPSQSFPLSIDPHRWCQGDQRNADDLAQKSTDPKSIISIRGQSGYIDMYIYIYYIIYYHIYISYIYICIYHIYIYDIYIYIYMIYIYDNIWYNIYIYTYQCTQIVLW